MNLTLPPLPYSLDALKPHILRTTLATHHDRHHAAYLEKTRALVQRSALESASLEEIVRSSASQTDRRLFNAAAQAQTQPPRAVEFDRTDQDLGQEHKKLAVAPVASGGVGGFLIIPRNPTAYGAITAAIGTRPWHGYPLKSGHRHHERGKEGTVLPVFDDGTTPVIAVKALRCSRPGAVPLLAAPPAASL